MSALHTAVEESGDGQGFAAAPAAEEALHASERLSCRLPHPFLPISVVVASRVEKGFSDGAVVWQLAATTMKFLGLLPALLIFLGIVLSAPAANVDATEEVRQLAKILRGNRAELEKLKPTAAQIAKIAATPEDAAKLQAYADKIFAQIPATGLGGNPDQTEISVTQGESLPGGYKINAVHFKKDLVVYGFKYVKPGETSGMAFDGLVKVDGVWVMIPKMWRAF